MDNKIIYEQHNWEQLDTSRLAHKIRKVLENIPADVRSIIDIGCGNGVITNELGKKYQVLGVDRSRRALEFVNTPKLEASCDAIPVEGPFDMVFSSELLEHLPDQVFYDTIKEFKRLARKYIFITVPNGENPEKLSIRCPSCGYIFNRPNHLRSFRVQDFEKLFPEYTIIRSFPFGKKVRYYHPLLLNLKRKMSPPTAWIPYYWIPCTDRQAICPRCEHQFFYPWRFHTLAFAVDVVNVLVSPKKPYWLFVLMEKKEAYV